MDWAVNNLAESLLIVGILLLVIEIVVLGFATFFLFFVGAAAVFTALLLYLGIIPDTLLAALLCTAIITAVSALFMWRPLKNMQTKVDTNKAKGDLVGYRFTLVEDVAPDMTPVYRYSGIDWKLKANQHISSGTEVEVTEAAVGVFYIKAV